MDLHVRPDLTAAHERAWAALASPGTWWTGSQRVELAATAIAAMTDEDPLPPWIAPSTVDGWLATDLAAPAVAHDAVYRVAAHASTLSEAWYAEITQQIGDLAYVEVVGIASTVAAVTTFRRAAGLAPWELPAPTDGEPSREEPPELIQAALNWVRVTPPADERASVVQAYSSVPAEYERLWMLGSAQYIPNAEMIDLQWTRGNLSRPQVELVAARVSKLRECFY